MMGMDHSEVVSSTFWGHGLPGSIFIAWAVYWMGTAIAGRPVGVRAGPLEPSLLLPVVKLIAAVVGIVTEIPGEGWYPQDIVMSWQHVTMYSVFGISGVVDLLARRGLLANQATFVAYALAMGNAGFLFWGHSAHGGVEGLVHAILALVFFTVGALALLEIVLPSQGLAWGRFGAQILLGSWFFVGAWIIYRSGWSLSDQFRLGWTYLLFSWTATLVVVATLGARLTARARSPA